MPLLSLMSSVQMTNVPAPNRRDAPAVPIRHSGDRLGTAAEVRLVLPCEKATCDAVNKATLNRLCMQNSLPAPHCRQRLWFSFFFDGTGNNLQADLGTNEHSNVARLYRSHSGEAYTGSEKTADPTVRQIFRIYIPGVGTYFREVNDKGGTTQGGAVGDEN